MAQECLDRIGLTADLIELRDKINNHATGKEHVKFGENGGFLLEKIPKLSLETVSFSYITGQKREWKPDRDAFTTEFSLAAFKEAKATTKSMSNLTFDKEMVNGDQPFDERSQKEFEEWEAERYQVSWVGKYSRFETVLAFLRTFSLEKEPLSSDQVEFGVKLYEKAEKLMEGEEYGSAFRCFVELLRRFPGFTLGYYKCALCLLELQILSTEHTPKEMRNCQFKEATEFFRCAVSLEPTNRHLLGNIDFALRLRTGVSVDSSGEGLPSIYRNYTLFPKSLADAMVFARLDRRLYKGATRMDSL